VFGTRAPELSTYLRATPARPCHDHAPLRARIARAVSCRREQVDDLSGDRLRVSPRHSSSPRQSIDVIAYSAEMIAFRTSRTRRGRSRDLSRLAMRALQRNAARDWCRGETRRRSPRGRRPARRRQETARAMRARSGGMVVTWSGRRGAEIRRELGRRACRTHGPAPDRLPRKDARESPPELPEMNLEHLKIMTDDTGMLQHGTFSVPVMTRATARRQRARTAVDGAHRGLGHRGRQVVRALASRYLAFVSHAFNEIGAASGISCRTPDIGRRVRIRGQPWRAMWRSHRRRALW